MLAEHGDDARILAGGQSLMAMLNLRLADPAVLVDITRIAELDDDPRPRRQDRGRRRGDAEPPAGLAGPCRRSCRCSPPRCRSSAISRPATRARCAARSRTPIRARKFRCRWRCSKARWCCARSAATRVLAAERVPEGHADDRARARRTDHRRALSGHGRARRRLPRSGAAARRFCHRRGRGDGREHEHGPARRRRHVRPAGGAAHRGRRRFRAPGRRRSTGLGTRRLRGSACLRRNAARYPAQPRPGRHRGGASDAPRKQGPARPDQADAQRPHAVGRSRAAHAAQRFPAPFARRHRNPCRLRARRMRLLHGADRRRRRCARA